jgi:hypothetical protein
LVTDETLTLTKFLSNTIEQFIVIQNEIGTTSPRYRTSSLPKDIALAEVFIEFDLDNLESLL